ncbi:hypothetical protein NFHSH190041_19180 [Shewanella sp. NFH-SH190041]|uniref:HD domain-containing protein n=1 Tax=Shewanella sp. NFH-SH190041 TaxID=2950245 RepID=UPI0021C30207|nr:HD domain-containing protein [Shewanella sp. NFH-SH190041]BDM64466.1 hypothetical protein NFHSH190041_19180 [Shewanella sp. NFH-SH190041]
MSLNNEPPTCVVDPATLLHRSSLLPPQTVGYCRVLQCREELDCCDQPFKRLQLSNHAGTCWAFDFNYSFSHHDVFPGQLAWVSLARQRGDWTILLHVSELVVSKPPGEQTLAQELMLPQGLQTQPQVFRRCVDIFERLSVPLRVFLNLVLIDATTCTNFMNVPASAAHHHAYRGGLFEHSVNVAQRIPALLGDGDSIQCQLGMVLGLVHDIGKVRTLSPQLEVTQMGKRVDHDSLTLELCARAFEYLDNIEPQWALELRHCLTCQSASAKWGKAPQTPLAQMLKLADNIDAKAGLKQ